MQRLNGNKKLVMGNHDMYATEDYLHYFHAPDPHSERITAESARREYTALGCSSVRRARLPSLRDHTCAEIRPVLTLLKLYSAPVSVPVVSTTEYCSKAKVAGLDHMSS